MRKLRALWLRVRALVDGRGSDQDLTDELESIVQMHVDDNLRAGMRSEEARRQALSH
jgi:macrolide transport system ATP-binding/permease protein